MKVGGWDISHENILKIIKSIPYVGAILSLPTFMLILEFYQTGSELQISKLKVEGAFWCFIYFCFKFVDCDIFQRWLYNPNSNTQRSRRNPLLFYPYFRAY